MNGSSLRLCFASDHPALAGHFPGHPIIPGVLLLDEALHALERAGMAVAAPAPASTGPHWYVSSVKFHHIVQAGEALRLEWRQRPDAGLHVELRAEARASDTHSAGSLIMSAAVVRRA
jgi:3-hydroxymyristoyl/3-hydroxydecanoyl-(acyl carrier protein) dehydratase